MKCCIFAEEIRKTEEMKKLFYMVFFAILLAACNQTPERKAETVIKNYLKTTLFKPETYKPINTQVQEAYSPYDDPTVFAEAIEFGQTAEEILNLETQAKEAKRTMARWTGRYQSAYGKNEYQEAKKEFDEINVKIEKLTKKGMKHLGIFKAKVQAPPKFIGYKVIHNYRADSPAGISVPGSEVFLFDEKFEKVIQHMSLKEYEMTQEMVTSYIQELRNEE